MEKTLFSIMPLLFVVSTLYLSGSFAQDSENRNRDLPAGAKVRIVLSHDVIKHRTEKPFYASVNAVEGLVFSPDGKTLASGSLDDITCLWDVTNRKTKENICRTCEFCQ